MAIKELSPRLQLNFDEYVETWRSLITEYYMRGMDENITAEDLDLDEQGLMRYSAELSAVILFLALNAWASRKRISQEIKTRVEQAIIGNFYGALYQDDELAEEYGKFYHVKAALFFRLLSEAGWTEFNGTKFKKSRALSSALPGILPRSIRKAGNPAILSRSKSSEPSIAEASSVFSQLAANSAPDAQLIGKTKFIVQK